MVQMELRTFFHYSISLKVDEDLNFSGFLQRTQEMKIGPGEILEQKEKKLVKIVSKTEKKKR